MLNTNEPPAAYRPPSADDYWESIEYRFSDYLELIHICRLETKEEAVEKAAGRPAARPYDLFPYSPQLSPELLTDLVDRSKQLAVRIRPKLERRVLTAEFIFLWQELCEIGGALETLISLGPADLGGAKRGLARSRHSNVVWFSHALMKLGWTPHKTRKQYERKIRDHIDRVLKGKQFTDQSGANWYERFLKDGQLRKTYRGDGDLSNTDVALFFQESALELPPLP